MRNFTVCCLCLLKLRILANIGRIYRQYNAKEAMGVDVAYLSPIHLYSSRDSLYLQQLLDCNLILVELDRTYIGGRSCQQEPQSLDTSYGVHVIPDIALRIELCISYICQVSCHLRVFHSAELLFTILLHDADGNPIRPGSHVCGEFVHRAKSVSMLLYFKLKSPLANLPRRARAVYESSYKLNAAPTAIQSLLLIMHNGRKFHASLVPYVCDSFSYRSHCILGLMHN